VSEEKRRKGEHIYYNLLRFAAEGKEGY